MLYFIITLQCFLLLKNRHSLIHTLHTQQLDSLINKERIAEEVGKSVEEVTIDDYNPTTRAYSGARTSTSSNLTGLGLPLTFSDSSMWSELKENLGDEAEKFNRVFEVNLNEPFVVAVETGKVIGDEKETVEVNAYKISFKADEEPIARQSSK